MFYAYHFAFIAVAVAYCVTDHACDEVLGIISKANIVSHYSVAVHMYSKNCLQNVYDTLTELQYIRQSFPKCIYASTSCRIYP